MWWFSTTKWPGNPRNSLRPEILGIPFVQESSEFPSSRNPRKSLRPGILEFPFVQKSSETLRPGILEIPFIRKSPEFPSSRNPRNPSRPEILGIPFSTHARLTSTKTRSVSCPATSSLTSGHSAQCYFTLAQLSQHGTLGSTE